MKDPYPAGLAALALASFASAGDLRTKLNGSLTSVATTGDVHALGASPDGQWVAYVADQDVDDRLELYATRRDGTGAVHKLNGPLVAGGAIHRFAFTPDSTRVVYLADQQVNDVDELYSAPVDGSAGAVKLNGPLVTGGDVVWSGSDWPPFTGDWPMTSDGQVLVYTADEDVDGLHQLYAVPLDGSAAAIALYVPPTTTTVPSARLASDDATLVFIGDVVAAGERQLYKVPLDASAAPVLLNVALPPAPFPNDFEISPDASRVAYLAGPFSGRRELFSVPLDLGSPAVKLNGTLPSQGDVIAFWISASSERVVYRADQDTDGVIELYSAPIDGSAAAVKLNDPITQGIIDPRAPRGARVVYADQQGRLHSVPIDRSASPVLLDPSTFGIESCIVTPDGSRVVTLRSNGALSSVPIDGSTAPTSLRPADHFVGAFRLTPDSQHVVYATQHLFLRELYSVPVDGSSAPVLLTGGVPWRKLEQDFAVDASSVVFRSDGSVTGVTELYAAPLDSSSAPAALNEPLATGTVMGEVTSFAVSPDGKWAVYADGQGFHGVPVARRGPARLLTPPGLSGNGFATYAPEVAFTPDSRHVFLSVATLVNVLLFKAPVDGSAPATLFHVLDSPSGFGGDFFASFRFTPDGATLVYEVFIAGYESAGGAVYSAPVDGSGPPVVLQGGGAITELFLASDGARAVLLPQGNFFNGTVLYSAPADGSSAATSLLPGTVLRYGGGLALAADGATVVYLAIDFFGMGAQPGLYSAPADDGSEPTLLAAGTVSLNRVNPALPHVAYVKLGAGVRELYHGPVDASSPATLLATLSSGVHVEEIVFSPDGSRLVYRADANVATQFELYVVPTDGSQAPVKVNGPVVSGGDVTEPSSLTTDPPHFAFTPDGARVVYRADARVNDIFELWSAPSAGGGPATMLHNPFTPGLGAAADFRVLASSRDLLFRGNSASGVLPLWQGRVDQLGPFKLRSGPFPHAALVETGFQVTAGERYVVYRSDHDVQGVTELYAFPLGHVQRLDGPPR